MSVNSSTNSNSSHDPVLVFCTESNTTISLAVFAVIKTFLHIPLSVLVLYIGHQRWHQQRSFATMSHSDIITCHLAAVKLVEDLGAPIYFCGVFTGLRSVIQVAFCLSSITGSGEVFFHTLTCLERYLAVVHPVTYLGLKKAGLVRIRNISIGGVWLLCFVMMGITAFYFPDIPAIPFSCLLVISFVVVSFCSFCVLCVLIRPGPGEATGNRKCVAQSKQRALHTMVAIMGVLFLWFVGYIVSLVLDASSLLSINDECLMLTSGLWFSLSSSLVLPLLFLHRAGKLPFSRSKTT